MSIGFVTMAALLAMSAPSQTDTSDTQSAAAEPAATQEASAAKPEEITDRNHPDYVRCRREPVIGSRARFTKRCFTNREWEAISQRGNDASRQIIYDAQTQGG